MPSSYTNLIYHVVVETQDRRPIVRSDWREELHRYIGGIVMRRRGAFHEIGGCADHVHLLASFKAEPSVAAMLRLIKANSSKWVNERIMFAELRPDPSPATMLRLIKANSSKWVNEQEFLAERFSWQEGYAAFTVSASQMDRVRRYIQNQERHHRRYTYDVELAELVQRHQPRRGDIG